MGECAVAVAVARRNASTVVRRATSEASARMKPERSRRNPSLATTVVKRDITPVTAPTSRAIVPKRKRRWLRRPSLRQEDLPQMRQRGTSCRQLSPRGMNNTNFHNVVKDERGERREDCCRGEKYVYC